ncbi:exported hypothetical protein [uncultured Paludibacter sp.]|nr:exported hypothetical protein [uncultured Paludibacter sp.]
MKLRLFKLSYFLFLLFLFHSITGFASEPYCQNLGFEMGNFTNWTGYTWIYQTKPANSTPKTEGIVYGRHTIMSDKNAYDTNTGNQLKIIPDGFDYSAKLGNTDKGGQHQSLQYTLHVDSLNSLLIVKFAVVFLNPLSGHTKEEEPRFTITFFDSKGDTIPDCANYDVYSGDATIAGFQTYYPSGSSEPVVWRDWTTVGIDLLPYIGQDITVEFMAADCTHQGHYGYAYITAQCQAMEINVQYCASDVNATLIAPDGFMTYKWLDNGIEIGTDKYLTIQNPSEGKKYQCELTSETGCTVTLESTIQRYNPHAQFTSSFDCSTNTVLFQNNSTATNGTVNYLWDFGDGSSSTETNPSHTYNTFGPKTVKLIVKNPPSTCIDTMTEVIYTFERQKVRIEGDSLYCLGKTVTLYGKDAYSYQWSIGETTDSIQVGTSGTYWVVGFSKDGTCNSLPYYYNVNSYPDWVLDIQGNTNLCYGDTISLKATGAVSYVWDTGEKTDEIKINKEGTYTVTGTNENGCIKQKSIIVTKIELPKKDFSLSRDKINLRNNTVNAYISPELNVSYVWDFGDGTQLTGANVSHQYSIDYSNWRFPITLTATNEYGCVSDTTKYVDVLFFIPNVFTPNGDGVNDIFMPNVKLSIYDRNGILMYEGTEGWDGNYKGQKADNDTYFYYLKYNDYNGEEKIAKGYIMLKR